jgi:hypothetical protein
MSAASPTRSNKPTDPEVVPIHGHIPPGRPWPAGDTLTHNTPPPTSTGERQVNPKRT